MAQRKKTRHELLGERYLKKVEVMRLLGCSQLAANRIYAKADKLDDEKFGSYRAEPHKVTIESVCAVEQLTLQTLRHLIKNAHPEG